MRGARHLVEQPPLPLDSIVANVNLDMISRSEEGELWACGTRYHKPLRSVLTSVAKERAADDRERVALRFGHDGPFSLHSWTRSSDHYPFHKQRIPFVYFGVRNHEDYHKPSDEFERIDPAFFESSVRLIIRSIEAIDAYFSATP